MPEVVDGGGSPVLAEERLLAGGRHLLVQPLGVASEGVLHLLVRGSPDLDLDGVKMRLPLLPGVGFQACQALG